MLKAAAQTDPHFTQNYTYPMYVNPALAGSSDGEYRASAIYRSQWGSVSDPYRTMGISFDARTNKNIALGINLLNQSAGDGGFNYLNTYASFAYTGVKFGKEYNQRIVLACRLVLSIAMLMNRNSNGESNGTLLQGYNAANPISESFAATSSTTLDVGAGALYFDATPNKKDKCLCWLFCFSHKQTKRPYCLCAEYRTQHNPSTICCAWRFKL
jgi:type IX secretion system PorP/SprF family membrane protein